MKKVNKVWGEELWIANNELYCCKILKVKKQYRCSYHMHKIKDETFYVRSGCILMEHEGEEFFMDNESPPLRICPGEYHGFTAVSDNVEIIEGSTQHFDEDSCRTDKSRFVEDGDFEEIFRLLYSDSSIRRR